MTGAANRRRRRAQRPAGPPLVVADAAGVPADAVVETRAPEAASAPTAAARTPSAGKGRAKSSRRNEDRGWRDLVGNSPSQLGVSGALRARDIARPDEDDLAAAEAELPIVRRQWTPPTEN